MKKKTFLILTFFVLALTLTVTASRAQSPLGTAFTYQGQLKNAGGPVNDTCNFQFSLWDDVSGGTQIGTTQTVSGVAVTDGLFTVSLDFGAAAFQGDARWLAIAVQCSGDSAYTDLTPRQALTAAPYAGYALSSPWSGLSGMPAGFADGVDNDTTYTAGTGLTLSDGQFSLDVPYRLPQSCTNSQLPKWNGVAWACAADNDTTYTAGTGLYLNATQFNLSNSYRLPQSCANGQLQVERLGLGLRGRQRWKWRHHRRQRRHRAERRRNQRRRHLERRHDLPAAPRDRRLPAGELPQSHQCRWVGGMRIRFL
jgi:hypothetical protein